MRASGEGEGGESGAISEERVHGVLPLVAKNLRRLRTNKGFSLERLARASGVSRAMLSQIELSRSAPTINTLWRIASALGIPFSALLGASEEQQPVVLRNEGAARLSSADGTFLSRPLFPFGQGPRKNEFYELQLAGHGREDAVAHPPGAIENLVVSSGRLLLDAGGSRYTLGTGDAIIFQADVPHSYINPDPSECRMYLVMTYP
ncbi:MAG TPA: XRE family transcriptional regulator [Polyangiales bacterium]|nr:XRE family transcriptional regulator [Polyangiales bacterium]